MTKIIDRTGKGSALTAGEYDSNTDSNSWVTESVTAFPYTVDVNDQNRVLELSSATAASVTLTDIANVSGSNIDTSNFKVTLKNIGAGTITVSSSGVDTFDDGLASKTLSQYQAMMIQTDSAASKWNILDIFDIVIPATANNLLMADANGRVRDSLVESDGAGNITANVTGTASSWQTARTITITGPELTGSVSIDGSADVTLDASLLGDSVGAWNIKTDAVRQSEIYFGSATTSTTESRVVIDTFARYQFYPMCFSDTTSEVVVSSVSYAPTSYGIRWQLDSPIYYFGQTAYMRRDFILASPPHDLGDGEIAQFAFAIMNSAGEVESMEIGREAVWHGLAAKTQRYGRKVVGKVDIVDAEGKVIGKQDKVESVAFIKERLPDGTVIEREVTHADKNKFMDVIPHPFGANDLTGKTVVLVDPVSPIMETLLEMQELDENPNELFHNGHLVIGNTPLKRSGPAGLMIPSVKWKQKKKI